MSTWIIFGLYPSVIRGGTSHCIHRFHLHLKGEEYNRMRVTGSHSYNSVYHRRFDSQLIRDTEDSTDKTREATQLICGLIRYNIWLLVWSPCLSFGVGFVFWLGGGGSREVINELWEDSVQFCVYSQRCQNRSTTTGILSSCLIFLKDPNHTCILKLNSNTRSSNTIS